MPPADIHVAPDRTMLPTAPAPVTVLAQNAQPVPPAAPAPELTTPADEKSAPTSPAVQDDAPAPAAPAKPRPFQLVNPLKRPDNAAPDSLGASDRSEVRPPMIPGLPLPQTEPVLPGPVIMGNSTPQVTIEKHGPTNPRAGESLQFAIVLRNTGLTPANQIRVEDEIPPGTRVVFADPPPTLQNDRATWVIPALAAGAETQLKIELEAQANDLSGSTSVLVSATTGIRVHIEAAPMESPRAPQDRLSLVVKAPLEAPAGLPVTFEVVAANHSDQRLTGLVLHVKLPAGLTHPAGKEIEADVGELGTGASKTFKIPVTAVATGRHAIEIRMTAQGGVEAAAQATIHVKETSGTGLSIIQPSDVRLILDKDAEFRIEITNHQAQGVTNVAVLDTLPAGVEFIAASDQGLFRADTRLVHWLIDNLAPAQTKTLTVRVHASAAGQFANAVAVRTESDQETQSSSQVHVQGMPDLVLAVSEQENPIEVGKTARYEIKVTNQGSAAATGVQVQATLPEGMAPTDARGPTNHRVEARQIIFASIPMLQPQGQAVFHVMAVAQAPGDQRFHAQLTTDQDGAPVVREERTFVYRD